MAKNEIEKKIKKDKGLKSILGSREDLIDNIKEYTEDVAKKAAKEAANQTESDIMAMIANGDLQAEASSHYANFNNKFYEGLSLHYAKNDTEAKKILNESVSVSKGDYAIYRDASSGDKQSDSARRTSQKVSYIRALTDPVVGAVPDSYKRWVVGRGVRYDFADNRVQRVIDEFWENNKMNTKLKKYYWRFITESEWFTLFFIDRQSGKVQIREIPPREIAEVETNPDDKEDYFSYKRVFYNTESTRVKDRLHIKYYPDINYYDTINSQFVNRRSKYEDHEEWEGPDKLVHFMKLMDNREVRGRVFFERFLNWAEWFKDWVIDRAIINHEKGRVVWILSLKGRKIKKNWTKFTSAPAGGTVKVETPNREWKPMSADIRADNVKEDGLFLLYQICTGSALPIHILTQRTDQQVYSSIRKSETAFSMSILDKQHSLSEEYLKPIFKKVIKIAVNSPAYNLPTHIDVVTEPSNGLKTSYNKYLEKYKENKISIESFIKNIKSLVRESKNEFKKKDINSNTRQKALKEADRLERYCDDGYKEILESNFEIQTPSDFNKLLRESYEFFEEGTKSRIKIEECPVHIEYPDLVKEDFLDMAKVLKIYDENDIASKHTIRKKAGLDPEEEKLLIYQEKEQFGQEYEDSEDDETPSDEDVETEGDEVDRDMAMSIS